MKVFKLYFYLLFLSLLATNIQAKTRVFEMDRLGLKSNTKENATPIIQRILSQVKSEVAPGDKIVLRFSAGRYDFHEEGAAIREYYISNHDQSQPKKVGIPLEHFKNLTLEGNGAEFVFHGTIIPLSLLYTEQCVLKDFSIDFENPHIAQVQVISNSPTEGITFKVAPWVSYRINEKALFEIFGEGWKAVPSSGIAFEEKTKHLVYNTSDLFYSTKGVKEISPRVMNVPNWKNDKLIPGTVIAMRTWDRPTPGIFLSHNKNTSFKNVKVHYSRGMGLLAQLCENITMDGFGVCLKGDNDPRYFTSQADATHFSGCKGKIISKNGLYEGMMDDAINIHGTYLKVVKRLDDHTLIGRYMHEQSYGFDWGFVGDEVQFIRSKTMEILGSQNRVVSITPQGVAEDGKGVCEFKIRFEQPIDRSIDEKDGFGIENLTWTPEVVFANNIVRNNRARGTLFSTPRKTVVENNLFDHTSGAAILLCGDCNGWYETGACREVIIRKNRFINSLTNMFQFTNAVISIYPEIPDLKNQAQYFHGGHNSKGIIIENNEFDTFDAPILYAKSVDGLIFRKNIIRTNNQYKPFHWNKKRILLERVTNEKIDIE